MKSIQTKYGDSSLFSMSKPDFVSTPIDHPFSPGRDADEYYCKEWTQRMRSYLQGLSQARGVLQSMQTSLSRIFEQVNTELFNDQARRHITRFPGELLARIFEYALGNDVDSTMKEWTTARYRKNLYTIALVNRRFNDTINNDVRFWTILSNDIYARSELRTFLSRSKAAPLDVWVCFLESTYGDKRAVGEYSAVLTAVQFLRIVLLQPTDGDRSGFARHCNGG